MTADLRRASDRRRVALAAMWLQIRRTLLHSDDVKIRWLMAFASLGWSTILWLPSHTFDRPAYSLMRWLPAWGWASLFFMHGAGAIWRILETKKRENWALWINGIGFATWTASTLLLNMQLGTVAAGTLLEAFACLFLLQIWIGTGFIERSTTA